MRIRSGLAVLLLVCFLVVSVPLLRTKFLDFSLNDTFKSVNVPNVLDLNGNYSFSDIGLFSDFTHLNTLGAQIYTQFVCERMATLL